MRYISLLVCCLSFISMPCLATKKACKPYLDKLHNIQSQQRQGYSLKRGNSLAEREAKARDKWWKCQQGKLPDKSKRKSKKKTKQNKLSENKRYNQLDYTAASPFKSSKAIVIKSPYQGGKLQAWLKFYQQPKGCQSPKTTQQFAFCMEDKRKQH